MAAPTGTEAEIYASPVKQSEARVKVRLDRPIATSDFVDEFSGSELDDDLWASWCPAGGSITVSGGNLLLRAYDTNGYPVVWAKPGQCFPRDLSIGWTLEWTMSFPEITGYGVFFRVVDLTHDQAIVAIKCNAADGLTVEMPDGTRIEELGQDTSSYSYELIYTPATNIAASQYELKRGGVSKNTMAATGRQAWSIVLGNMSVQTAVGDWTHLSVSRVDVNLVSNETQDWPEWTDREEDGNNQWWGYIPWLSSLSMGFHERNDVDQCVITMPQSGYVTSIGYRENWFSDWLWANREVIVESRQGDGHRWTTWKTVFHGFCDEPRVQQAEDGPRLEVTIRDKNRRRLQMAHLVRGYSDAGGAIEGVIMHKTWPEIVEDQCDIVGLASADYNILSDALKPRTWQVMGESAIDNIRQIAEDAVATVYVNRTQANFGRIEVQDYDYGSDTPDFYTSPDLDAVLVDWSESVIGMTAQVVVTVQHSEFGEFSDSYPRAPIPPNGAIIRMNSAVAQTANDINATRLLPFMAWRRANRELDAITMHVVGQDWYEVNLEAQVLDRRVLDIDDQYYLVVGADYNWRPEVGWLATIHLVNQHPENAIMRASPDVTVAVTYQYMPLLTAFLTPSGALLTQTTKAPTGGLSFSGSVSCAINP